MSDGWPEDPYCLECGDYLGEDDDDFLCFACLGDFWLGDEAPGGHGQVGQSGADAKRASASEPSK